MFRLGSAGRESWRLGEMSGDKAVVVERNGLIYIGETLGDGGHLYNGIMGVERETGILGQEGGGRELSTGHQVK